MGQYLLRWGEEMMKSRGKLGCPRCHDRVISGANRKHMWVCLEGNAWIHCKRGPRNN